MVIYGLYKPRLMESMVLDWLHRDYSIVLVGPRQAGKTTLVKHLAESTGGLYLTLDDPDVLQALNDVKAFLEIYFSGRRDRLVLYLDEAQYDPGIGRKLKYLHDVAGIRFVATGSGSFDVKVRVTGELVGRVARLVLLPLNFHEYVEWRMPELAKVHKRLMDETLRILRGEGGGYNPVDHPGLRRLWMEYVVYGGYPRVVLEDDSGVREELLRQIVVSYIDRDVMGFLGVREHVKFRRTLLALAQLAGGILKKRTVQEVAGVSFQTLESYLSLLEETYIVFTVPRHPGGLGGLRKQPKIYFYDNGLLNALLGDFKPFNTRPDTGRLLESFVARHLKQYFDRLTYWKTKGGGEVDFIVNNIPVEAKMTPRPAKAMRYAAEKLGSPYKVVVTPGKSGLEGDVYYVKPWHL